jgi:osmoprotectant transport system permease protein
METVTYIIQNAPRLLQLAAEHIQLSLIAVLFGLVVGIPTAILISRIKRLVEPVLWVASIFQTIPALAFIGFVMVFMGLSRATGITVLFFYTLLPIIRTTYTGLTQVDPGILEAARGMGMTGLQILWRVQLPLALSVILVGVRIALVIAVGTASIMSLAGAGGLGQEIFAGIDRVQNKMILAGALPAALLALLADLGLGALEQMLTPRGAPGAKPASRGARVRQRVLVGATALVFLLSFFGGQGGARGNAVVIGSKDFTESILLGEVVAQLIEGSSEVRVVRKLNLGGTKVNFDGMRGGSLDMYAEYDGTGYGIHLGHTEPITDPGAVFDQVKREFEQKFHMTWSKPFGFNNTYALAMLQDVAARGGIKTASDLAKHAPRFVFGTTNEFMGRKADGFDPMVQTYGYRFKDVKTMTAGLRYKAIAENQIQVMDAYATDGKLKEFGLVILPDDKRFFPPYKGAMVVRQETLKRFPQLMGIIDRLAGTITDDLMREMNYRVEVKGETVETVAREFLRAKGLVK